MCFENFLILFKLIQFNKEFLNDFPTNRFILFKQRSCTTDWSSCEALEQCLYHRQLIEDPSDDNSYFICIRDNSKFKESYSLYRRDCTPGRTFDPDYGLCLDDDDYRRIQKAKRRRQQQKCQKKKAQKNKKKSQKKKKKSPQKKN